MIQWLLFITSFLFLQDGKEVCADKPVNQAIEYVSANQQGYGWVVSQTSLITVEMNVK